MTKTLPRVLSGIVQIPYTFVLMNWAAVAGLYYFARGHGGFWNVTQTASSHRVRHV
jgi:hypothetical protein